MIAWLILMVVCIVVLGYIFGTMLERGKKWGDDRDVISVACKCLHMKPHELFVEAYKWHTEAMGEGSHDLSKAHAAYKDYAESFSMTDGDGIELAEIPRYTAPNWLHSYLNNLNKTAR